MKLLVNGYQITTNRRYIKFTYGKYTEIRDDYSDDTLHVTFRKGFRSSDIMHPCLKLYKDVELSETKYLPTTNPQYNINGIIFTKVVPQDIAFSIYIVKDEKCMRMMYGPDQCTILVPVKKDYEINDFISLIKQNQYLEFIGTEKSCSLKGVYSLMLSNKPVKINSGNEFKFSTKSEYTQYILSDIDCQEAFISSFGSLLKTKGIQLQRYPIDSTLDTVDHVVWRFTDLNKHNNYKTDDVPFKNGYKVRTHVSFELTTPNLLLLNDIKNKYQNLEFISNMTTYTAYDKLNRPWSCNIEWSEIGTDFNQDYDTDSQGNAAFKTSFDADIEYYIIKDATFVNAQNILFSVISASKDDSGEIEEKII